MKKTQLSNSALNIYSTCSRKYKFWYVDRLRPSTISGALLFGSALDRSLNHLVKERKLDEAIDIFEKSFRYQNINNKGTYIPTSELVLYADSDFDEDLLLEEDLQQYKSVRTDRLGLTENVDPVKEYKDFLEKKERVGYNGLESMEKILYNQMNWLSMRRKGLLMVKAYNEKVLPKIKKVIAIQERISLENCDGDTLMGYLDLVVEWEDGKIYILDNKTSLRDYEKDSAGKSQQLLLYYHAAKDKYKVDGVGFIVLYKRINKNRTKICSLCKYDGSGGRHKTCPNVIVKSRCDGEWIEKINPDVYIEYILNEVSPAAEDLVIETFDEANKGIKTENFGPNLSACYKWGKPCEYLKKCWEGKDTDLVKLEKKEEE